MPQLNMTTADLLRALEAGPIGRWSWDAASDAFADDSIAAQLFVRSSAGRRRASHITAIHPDDRPSWSEGWRIALDPTGDGILRIRYRYTRPSDSTMLTIAEVGRVVFAAGRAERAVGIVREVTAALDGAERAAELASRLAGIVSISADAIISMDDDQNIIMFNDGAVATFGYAREEVIGRPLSLLVPQAVRSVHANHVNRFGVDAVAARRMGERTDIRGQRKNGDIFDAEASISKVDVGGKRIYTAVLRDITERKQSQTLLERRVEAATQELRLEMKRRENSQAQLVRTQRLEAVGQLTGGIAHDFNNLLTVIMGNLELLDMRVQDDKSRTFVSRAREATEMGARLTSRLLTFARRRSLKAEPLNLNDQVIGMAELLERTLGEQIVLTTSLESAPWTVVADASETENAILNLALNARDAMPGGGRLVIETANVQLDNASLSGGPAVDPGDYVRLSVTDTGSGMTEDVMRRAFEPFFTTKETGKGTGLGLSSIYGFAQQALGTVTIYSEVGRGTTVNIYLPRTKGDEQAGRRAHLSQALPLGAGEHVLLVEDNAGVRDVTRAQLEMLGYRVTAVSNGVEAQAALAGDDRFDLVFSDVVMPGGLSGFDLARWIAERRPGLGVILASGYPGGVLTEEGDIAAPHSELLRKPFTRADLAAAVRRGLSRTKP